MSEPVPESLSALEGQQAFDAICKTEVEEARADPRPPVPLEEAFARVRERIARRAAE